MLPQWIAILAIGFVAVPAFAEEPQALTTKKERVSYTVGVDLGRNIKQLETEVDLDLLMKGVRDGMNGDKLLMTEKELFATRNSVQLEMKRKKSSEKMKKLLKPKGAGEKKEEQEAAPAEEKR